MDSRADDQTLLLAVAERDMGAFRTFAVQDTFVALWQRPRGFRGDGDIGQALAGQRAARIRRGVRGQDADRRTGRDGRRRRRVRPPGEATP